MIATRNSTSSLIPRRFFTRSRFVLSMPNSLFSFGFLLVLVTLFSRTWLEVQLVSDGGTTGRSSAANWQKSTNLIAPATDSGFGIGVFEFRENLGAIPQRFYRA